MCVEAFIEVEDEIVEALIGTKNGNVREIISNTEKNKLPQKLSVICKELSPNEAQIIADKIKNNQFITELKFFGSLGDEEIKPIAEALKGNKSVIEVNISRNNIGDEGVKVFAAALRVNQTIRNLDLSSNRLSGKGVEYLAEALKENHSITELNLSYNFMGNDGMEALAKVLKNNKSIVKLTLLCNGIEDKGAEALVNALKTNKSILSINISCNFIKDKFYYEKLDELCSLNHKSAMEVIAAIKSPSISWLNYYKLEIAREAVISLLIFHEKRSYQAAKAEVEQVEEKFTKNWFKITGIAKNIGLPADVCYEIGKHLKPSDFKENFRKRLDTSDQQNPVYYTSFI
jgi:hypothetical protein